LWFEQVAFPTASRRLRADVAHVPYWAPPLAASVPTVVTIHDLIPLLLPEYRAGWLVRLYTGLVSRSARNACLVLTDSEAGRRDILHHLRLPAGRVRTVPLAASDGYSPEPAPDDAATCGRLGLPGCYVLYLGGFDRRKNVATTLAAYRQALTRLGSRCPLVIAGRLPEHDSAFAPDPRRLARELGIDDALVRFPGFVDEEDAPAVYRGASAFIFPSRYEGFGLPPLEAMACGTPVVGSNTSSMPEIVGEAGMLFDPDDTAGMASALVRLVSDRPLRAEFSKRAVTQAARFSWCRTAELTLAAYQDTAAIA
jgi:glycosyltransferase involved in cell wall biosynthesis